MLGTNPVKVSPISQWDEVIRNVADAKQQNAEETVLENRKCTTKNEEIMHIVVT